MDELRAVSLFVRAAEAGSFNRVAESQGVTPQAVSKAIRQLEQALGVRLFHRTTRKTSLTDEGGRLLEQVKPNVEGLAAALASVRGAAREEGGTIRVAASGTVGRKVLVPLMAKFQRAHPRVEFDLILEERVTDRVTHRIDVGFRSGAAPDEQVIARRLFPIQQLVCAAPDYWRAHGMPASVEELSRHRCTAYRQPGSGRPVPWEFDVDGVVRFQQMSAGLCSSDTEAEMHAVIAGMGVGQIDGINAAAPLRDGRLVPILTTIVSERMGLYLVYAHRTDMPARVRRFIAFALERLQGSDAFHLPPATLQDLHDRFRATLTPPGRTD